MAAAPPGAPASPGPRRRIPRPRDSAELGARDFFRGIGAWAPLTLGKTIRKITKNHSKAPTSLAESWVTLQVLKDVELGFTSLIEGLSFGSRVRRKGVTACPTCHLTSQANKQHDMTEILRAIINDIFSN